MSGEFHRCLVCVVRDGDVAAAAVPSFIALSQLLQDHGRWSGARTMPSWVRCVTRPGTSG